jgi:hypothetical protein
MAYKLITTDEMEGMLSDKIDYLLYKFKNEQAAKHLIGGIEEIYNLLEINPYIYRESQDSFMKALHYHEATIAEMDYILIYKIDENNHIIYIMGIFNTRENYVKKIQE